MPSQTEQNWKAAIINVLRSKGEAMHYTDITQAIISDGLRTKLGATPASTVSSVITTSIASQGDASPFEKVGRGMYRLKPSARTEGDGPEGSDDRDSVVRAYGMFWLRDNVSWNTRSPCLWGAQGPGATRVDFGKQLGVYILYDGRVAIYVGRTTDRPLGVRLWEHTQDRLRSRWDRFSWFGLLDVTAEGRLEPKTTSIDQEQWIVTLEALLIEALEPPQNRRRGDGFVAIEYVQVADAARARDRVMQQLSTMFEAERGHSEP